MTNKNQSAFVQMPSSTVTALKEMLFSSTDGVNLNGIIDDITGGQDNKDLVAINVALAFSGMKPELDTTERIHSVWEWGGSIKTCKMISMSLITSRVDVEVTEHNYNLATEEWEKKDAGLACMSLEQWYDCEASEENGAWKKVISYQKEKQAKKNAG